MIDKFFGLESDYNFDVGDLPPEHRPDPIYDQLFPYYIELCALSQFRAKGGNVGGVPGHGVMYLHGACRDPKSHYPQLCLCEDADTPEVGVGVSVNRYFRNANWMATPGRDLFFNGNLGPGERVTEQVVEDLAQHAIDLGLYEGLKPHRDEVKAQDLAEFIREESIGTDFALTFARSIFCARVPVTKEMLQEIIVFLNDLNRQYATGEKEYHWNGIHDNCVHAMHNALAATAIWPPTLIGTKRFQQLKHLAIPANEYLNLAFRTADFPLEDFDAILEDEEAHNTLLGFGWLPARHGALIKTLDVHQPTDVYDPEFHLFLLESARSKKIKQAEQLLYDPKHYDLEPNLQMYKDRYQQILDKMPPDEGSSLRGDRHRLVRRKYYEYIQAQLEDVTRKLSIFEATESK